MIEAGKAYGDGQRGLRREPSIVGVDGLPMTICPAVPYVAGQAYAGRLAALLALAWSDLALDEPAAAVRIMLPEWLEDHPHRAHFVAALVDAMGSRRLAPEFCHGGPAELLSMIGHAATAVLRGQADDIVVGGVDSLLHPELLDRLAIDGRVLARDNPYGAVPAEAACVIHLSAGCQAELGQVLAVFRGREPEDVAQPKGVVGRGLAAAYRQVGRYLAADRLISDMNGQRWRAEEFGFAVSAAGSALAGLSDRVEVPALQIGDCGTAAAAVLLALAMTDPPRRTHPAFGPTAMLSASSVTGLRAAMVVQRSTAAFR